MQSSLDLNLDYMQHDYIHVYNIMGTFPIGYPCMHNVYLHLCMVCILPLTCGLYMHDIVLLCGWERRAVQEYTGTHS